jgi:aspartate/methionine/tyrosine aminotransferase
MFATRTNWRLETNRLAKALEEHRRSGRELFDLTASNPTTCGLTYPEEEILAALADPRALVYRPESKGLREAREAVAEYYRGRKGFSGSIQRVDPERILLASGTSEAYSHIFRLLCEKGDEILVPAPSYPLFEFLADLADVRLVPYLLLYDHGWQIDFASLRAALTTHSRAVLVVHPNNPTGSFVKPREAAELAELCAAQEMAIVADEVFLDYAGGADPMQTFALSDAALTFTLSGLSKISLLPQMKLAWVIVSGPEAVVQTAVDRLEIIADTYLSPSTPTQLALPKFLSLRQSMQEQLQQRIFANLSPLDNMLRESKSPTRLDREGGWYAILRVPVTGTDDDLIVELLMRHSVLVHPGHFFNFSREGFLVLSLITPQDKFKEGALRMSQFFDQ